MKKPKRPRDPNELAKSIVDLATRGQRDDEEMQSVNIHAVELGRLGGLKGGRARAKSLSKAKRSEIAKKAAKARWKKRTR